jgi:hypothetical protein
MLNSETLEVAIGMVFLFLLMSLICTAIKEWIEALLKWRAMDLERAMRTLLADDDGSTTQALYTHPIIYSLFQGTYDAAQLRSSWMVMGTGADKHMRLGARRNLPSYIPTAHFATAFIDYVARGPATPGAAASPAPGPLTIDLLRQQAAKLPEHLSRTVIAGIDYANGDIAKVRKAVEQWFDGAMDRASGWYKRRTQALLFTIGLLAAVVLNVDALHILHRLTSDKTFRDVVVNRAAETKAPAASSSAGDELARIQLARGELEAVTMPIGWESPTTPGAESQLWPTQFCTAASDDKGTLAESCTFGRNPAYAVVRMGFGWLVTALAVMLGAPFWFDVLNRIMVIRSTVKPHEKSPEEPSQDGGGDKVQRVVFSADPASPPPAPAPAGDAAQPAT